MGLFDRIEKHLDNYKAGLEGDYLRGIQLVNDGTAKNDQGATVGLDADGSRIHAWDESVYGPRPTIGELPPDAESVAWCKEQAAKLKISRKKFDDATTVAEFKAAVLPYFEHNNCFDDQ